MSEISQFRRKSVDVGGLALALGEDGRGNGWGGWDEDEISEAMSVIPGSCCLSTIITNLVIPSPCRYAELLSDMYTQTQSTVNFHFSTLSVLYDIRLETRESLNTFFFFFSLPPSPQHSSCYSWSNPRTLDRIS
jgi:hypothetical protein